MKKINLPKIFVFIIIFIMFIILSTGATYAYYLVSASDNKSITGNIASSGLDLSITKVFPVEENYDDLKKIMVPQLDSGLDSAVNKKCVDDNGNIVCHVYKIDIKNMSTINLKLKGLIYFNFDGNFENLYWKIMESSNIIGSSNLYKATILKEKNDLENSVLVDSLLLNSINSQGINAKTYYVIIWIRENNQIQNTTDVGNWTMSVEFDDIYGNGGVTSTLLL